MTTSRSSFHRLWQQEPGGKARCLAAFVERKEAENAFYREPLWNSHQKLWVGMTEKGALLWLGDVEQPYARES